MEPSLHTVTKEELPILKQWLEKYLPESRKIYFVLEETIRGLWHCTTFYTLGWPNILAASEGLIDSESPCAPYLLNPACSSAYSPSLDHLETLLTWPGLLDWSKPMFFPATSKRLLPVFEKLAKKNGGHLHLTENVMMQAQPGDIPLLPVPEGFEVRDLDPDVDTDYTVSTWPHRRHHTDVYVREHLRKFPSVGLFDKTNGKCVGVEVSYVYGALGMPHVREEYRGRGLGKVVTSHLAHKHFRQGRSVAVWVIKGNDASIHMHASIGFKMVEPSDYDFIMYYFGDLQEYLKEIGAHH